MWPFLGMMGKEGEGSGLLTLTPLPRTVVVVRCRVEPGWCELAWKVVPEAQEVSRQHPIKSC